MPDILLIDTNTTPFNEAFPVYPIGLDYLQGALMDAGPGRVEILNLTRTGGPLGRQALAERGGRSRELIRRKLAERPWDLVGLSLRNIDSTYPILSGPEQLHYYLPQLMDYLDCVAAHAHPSTRVVLGGTGFSIMPEVFLTGRPATWHGVVGPGEDALVELARGLAAGADPPRLIRAAGGPGASIGRLRNRALLSAYLDLPQGEGCFGLRSKTGCGQACGYCPYPLINGPGQGLKDPATVVEEIRLLAEVHAAHPARPPLRFMFADDIFNRPREHARAVLEAMLAAGLRPDSWHAYLDPGGLDRQFLELVLVSRGWSRPGPGGQGRAVFFPMDLESGDDRMLARLGKPYRAQQVLEGVEAWRAASGQALRRGEIQAAGLGFHLLVGYPGEDEDSIAATCRLVNQARPEQVAAQLAVRVYPGTPLARQTRGRLWRDQADLVRPVFAPIAEDQIITWLRRHLDAAYDRLARKGNMLLIGRSD